MAYMLNNSAPEILPAALSLWSVEVEDMRWRYLGITRGKTLFILKAQALPVNQLWSVEQLQKSPFWKKKMLAPKNKLKIM
jgi:hypothetical protein